MLSPRQRDFGAVIERWAGSPPYYSRHNTMNAPSTQQTTAAAQRLTVQAPDGVYDVLVGRGLLSDLGARLTALQGAQILFYPTAIGWHPAEKAEYGEAQHDSWEVMQRAHAIANGCYVCAPNRVGHERVLDPEGKPYSTAGIEFWGQSFVASPNGQVVARAAVDEEQVLIVPCDLAKVEFSRTHWPFLRDRRIDAYENITKRFID